MGPTSDSVALDDGQFGDEILLYLVLLLATASTVILTTAGNNVEGYGLPLQTVPPSASLPRQCLPYWGGSVRYQILAGRSRSNVGYEQPMATGSQCTVGM
jgi:hypothetical protein